jgi:hypothetical protein
VFSKKWIVYAKQPFGSPRYVIEYLDRYIPEIAIGKHEIWKESQFNAIDPRIYQALCPEYFTRIRHYRLLSSS